MMHCRFNWSEDFFSRYMPWFNSEVPVFFSEDFFFTEFIYYKHYPPFRRMLLRLASMFASTFLDFFSQLQFLDARTFSSVPGLAFRSAILRLCFWFLILTRLFLDIESVVNGNIRLWSPSYLPCPKLVGRWLAVGTAWIVVTYRSLSFGVDNANVVCFAPA